MKNIIIFEGIASAGKTTLEKLVAESLPDSVVILEDTTLMPVINNADNSVALAHLEKQLKTIKDLSAQNVIVDRFHLTHAFRTQSDLKVFSGIEQELQGMGNAIVVLLTIDPEHIKERIEETALRRKDGWKKGAPGTIEEKVAYYKNQQEVLLSSYSVSRLRHITIDTTQKDWDAYAVTILNSVRNICYGPKDSQQDEPKEPVKITFKDRFFTLVKERRNKTRVYRADDETCYLRTGPVREIQQELGFHKRLLERAYPVPELLEVGEGDSGEEYYLESSVGTEKFGLLFSRECTANGSIDDASFSRFLEIVERFLEAQRNDVRDDRNWETVFIGTHFDLLLEEMPDEQTTIMQVWKKIMKDLHEVLFVLCHGDFNAFNVLPGGVIDFETPFDGPFGYDLVSAVTSNNWFPRKGDYEMFAAYFSTDQQIQKMWELAPEIVKNFDALFMLRSTWAVVRMQEFPKLQAWRYTLFRQAMDRYLKGDSLYEWWLAMPQE